jgi:hypothetical protein
MKAAVLSLAARRFFRGFTMNRSSSNRVFQPAVALLFPRSAA